MTSTRSWRLPALLLALPLAACAGRPGPELLSPAQASIPGARVAAVYVATSRARQSPDSNVFTNGHTPMLNYAAFRISVPPEHRAGNVELPASASPPDPAAHFTTVQHEVLDRPAFEGMIASRGGPRTARKASVFVHGFNTNFQEALFRLAQMAADGDVNGTPVLFAWPSEARLTGYVADKDAVTASRDQLAEVLTILSRDSTDVTVIAHSMGAWLTVEALRQLRLAHKDAVISRLRVVLAAPDIDVDVFRTQMAVIGPLSPPLTVLVSRDDIALSVSSFIAHERPRLGMVDVDDPRVQEAAVMARLEIVDVSSVKSVDRLHHDRFASLAALYPRLAAADANGAGLRRAGAFVFDAVGATISSPFTLAGRAISGQ
jgi:esterase/lipase superfamily enzyme